MESINEALNFSKVTTDGEAADYFKIINNIKRDIKEKEEFKLNEIAKIEKWYQGETKHLNDLLEHYQGELIAYYIAKRRDNPKARVTSPWGKITTRKSKKYSYDESILIEYLKENAQEYIRTKHEIDKSKFRCDFKNIIQAENGSFVIVSNDGEIVPGVTVTEEETINIKEV